MNRIAGRVYIKRPDGGHEALEPAVGVVVSTDSTVGVTDAKGAYSLPVRDGDRFVKITTPRGMRADGAWFHDFGSEQEALGAGSFDFTLASDPARDVEEFQFLQITDLHVDSRKGRVTPQILREDLSRLMAGWSDKAAFLAVTGDLTTHADVEELVGARQVLSEQPLPVFGLPGNHDLRGEGGTKRYIDHLGPDSYSFDWGPVHFIAYNAVDDEPPTLTSWLLQDLAQVPKGRPVVLLLHFPLGDIFYAALRPYPIVASLSGHWHASRLYHDGQTAHYVTPPLSFGGGDYTPGCYRVFTWNGGELQAQTFALPPVSLQVEAGASSPALGYGFRAADEEPVGRAPNPSGTLTPLEWPHPMGGTARVNVAEAPRGSENGTPRTQVTEAWRFRLPGGVRLAAPVVSSGRLLIGTQDEDRPQGGQVVCLDASTGEHQWTTAVGESVKNTLACHDGLVIGVTITGEVFALDIESGAPVWRAALHTPSLRWIYSAPLVENGRVVVGMSGHFACFDAATGETVWERRDLSGSDWICSFVSPAAADGLVIVGFSGQDVGLLAFDADTGEIRWQSGDRTDSASSTPAVCGDVFYVVRRGGMLQKLTVGSGEVLWTSELPARTPATPVPHGESLYLAAGDGRVLAVGTDDGALQWDRHIGAGVLGAAYYGGFSAASIGTPLLAGEALWLPGGDGVLHAFAAADGAELAQHHIGVPLLSAPVPATDGLYVTDTSGCIHALRYV